MAEAPWRQAAPTQSPGGKAPGRAVEPPLVVQNAMLTKDKKPFTYTPGGLDLSEIRSPRMARRLELNAMNEGVGPLPQTQQHQQAHLPPSALAAMQPQLSVQVFPTGKIPQPPHHGGPPPPPPPPIGIPPPPKAPPRSSSPLPLDSFERPDMTKIIPENPMAMLRKTSGPVVKQDPILNKENYSGVANNAKQIGDASFSRQQPSARQPESPLARNAPGISSAYAPPINQNVARVTPPRQPQSPSAREQSPGIRGPPAYYKRQPSTPQSDPESPVTVQKQPPLAAAHLPLNIGQMPQSPQSPQTPDSPKAALSKAPTPWLTQKRPQPETPEWAVNDNRNLSPPVQEQKPQIQEEPSQAARPWQTAQDHHQQQTPWRQQQQPQYPRENVQPPPQAQSPPWQKQQKQPELQPWQQPRQAAQPEPQSWQQQQKLQPQTAPLQSPQPNVSVHVPQGNGVRKQVNLRDQPQAAGPVERTEVVIVNEPPQVFQHPGPRVIVRQGPSQQNNYQQQPAGVRIIPVQRDSGSSNGHVTSQQKFNSPGTPVINRVLQKITNTDGDDDENQPVVEHSPKMPHNFPQRQAGVRKPESDHELMNKFKQEFDLDDYFDFPKYRGGHIPSKMFWEIDDSVPQSQQNNGGPVVRTIPIQIEGDGPSRKYVPPSEQTVAEPKKYMGSSIPSRSFKILQAMTGPDDCVNPVQASENNENYPNDPSLCTQWGFVDPNYPHYYYDPYWGYVPQSYTAPVLRRNKKKSQRPVSWGYFLSSDENDLDNTENQSETVKKKSNSNRTTPVPWLNDNEQCQNRKSNNSSARCTPVPFWPYYYPPHQYENTEAVSDESQIDSHSSERNQQYSPFPPYWDPYYYGYYYPPPAYPPVYSPYPFYPPPQNDTEEVGYSSTDEMSYYGSRFATMRTPSNNRPKSVVEVNYSKDTENLCEQSELLMSESEKENADTEQQQDHSIQHCDENIVQEEDDSSIASDSDPDMIAYEVCRKPAGLQTIPSVSDVKVYDTDTSSHCSADEESENSTEENDDSSSVCAVDETIPHQLSVIFEESERTESILRSVREGSVATTISETATTIANSDEEKDEDSEESDGTVLVKLPLTIKFSVAESQKVTTLVVGTSEIKPQFAVKNVKEVDTKASLPNDSSVKQEQCFLDVSESNVCISCPRSSNTTTEQDPERANEPTDEIDWWGQIAQEEDLSIYHKLPKERKSCSVETNESLPRENEIIPMDESMYANDEHEIRFSQVSEDIEKSRSCSECEASPESRVIWNIQPSKNEVQFEKDTSKDTNLINGNAESLNNLNEGMGKMEAVLSNIINAINNRTATGTEKFVINNSQNTESTNLSNPDTDFWAEIKSSSERNHNDLAEFDNSEPDESQHVNSACYSDSSLSVSNACNRQSEIVTKENDSNCKTDIQIPEILHEEEPEVMPLSVQERIKALQEAAFKKPAAKEDEDIKVSIREKISVFEENNLTVDRIHRQQSFSRKSSLKSYEEFSEEDGDSGVTSDISRHISETEAEPDLSEARKINKYQRASTHSRLFRLLQDEFDEDENTSEQKEQEVEVPSQMQSRRDHLNLPLVKNISEPESFSSSGFTSPGSPTVNEKILNELIHNLLKRKQGKIFKHMTMEKVQAAAIRMIQDDMDGFETLSSSEDGGSFLSPQKPGTGSSTPAQTPQEFYTEYSQYYESWAEAEKLCESQCDILPSKAFKLIQEHVAMNKTGAVAGLLARCPRVLSNKNVQELIKLMEDRQSLSPSPEPSQILDANEASAS